MTEPFSNEYNIRKVAESESKACYICYKPSETVLLSENKVDFFYICPSHLLDSLFAECVKNDVYIGLVKQRDDLNVQLEVKRKLADLLKPYIWSKLKGGENKEYDAAVEVVLKLVKEQEVAEKSVSDYVFKKYTLHKDVYKIRLHNLIRARNDKKRQEMLKAKLDDPGFFPSAPRGGLSGAPGPQSPNPPKPPTASEPPKGPQAPQTPPEDAPTA